MKYLGIDWGERKIGLALGSSETGLALPHGVTENVAYIDKLCKDEGIDVVVVGRLRDENKKFDEFIDFLNGLNVKVGLTDERMSTKMAGKLDANLNLRRGSGSSKGQDDAVAAQIILQGYLDSKKTTTE